MSDLTKLPTEVWIHIREDAEEANRIVEERYAKVFTEIPEPWYAVPQKRVIEGFAKKCASE